MKKTNPIVGILAIIIFLAGLYTGWVGRGVYAPIDNVSDQVYRETVRRVYGESLRHMTDDELVAAVAVLRAAVDSLESGAN